MKQIIKKIVAVNASPRIKWNTAALINEAAEGARSEGADVDVFDLAKLEKFSGCVSCFACKLEPNTGKCIYRDGLAPVLEAIREADGLIVGTPNYFGDVTAGFRAFYERLLFQYLTYKTEPRVYPHKRIPVLFIMTSNAAEEHYAKTGYEEMVGKYQGSLENFIGSTKVFIAGNTLQVKNYDRFNWTMFDPEEKIERHEKVFPEKRKEAFSLGAEMVRNPWE